MKNFVVMWSVIILLFSACLSGCDNSIEVSDDVFLEERWELENQIYDLEGENEYLREEIASLEDEYHDFQMIIANLMYDGEYEVVEMLLSYNRDVVGDALKEEFGTKNLEDIIDYLERR